MTIYFTADDIISTLGSNVSLGISMLNINNIGSILSPCVLFIHYTAVIENKYMANSLYLA